MSLRTLRPRARSSRSETTVGPGEGDLRGRSSEGRRRLRDLGHSHGHKRARARANCAHGCARVGLDSARLLCFTRLVVLGALDIGVLLADARDLLVGDLARRLGDLGLAGALVRGGELVVGVAPAVLALRSFGGVSVGFLLDGGHVAPGRAGDATEDLLLVRCMHGLFAALARTKEYERIGRALDVFSGGRRRGAIGAERVGDAGRRSDERMHRNGLAVFLETDDSWTMIRRVDALRSMGLTGRGHFAKSFGGRLSAAFWRALYA